MEDKNNVIKNVIFDIGGVLVDFRYYAYMKELGFSEEVMKAIEKRIIINDIWNRLDLGIESEEDLYKEAMQSIPEYQEEAKLFFEKIVDIVEPYPYTVSWINSLKAKGYKIYLLSNYPESMYDIHEKAKYDFVKLVDGKVISGKVKMAKPDSRIYKYIFEKYNLNPAECIYIDDRKDNIEAGRKEGLHSIIFDNYENVCKEIERIEIGF